MKRRWTVALEVALLAALIVWIIIVMGRSDRDGVTVKVRLPDARDTATLIQQTDGRYVYRVTHNDGTHELYTPEQLAESTHTGQLTRSWWMRMLNISGAFEVLWVAIGLGGQVLFTGRMVVQWLASEKERKSVVPPSFWWMSLIGASMLVLYFIWRHDPVGILGQAVGWFVYVRNLWFIYRGQPAAQAQPGVPGNPAPEPELTK